MWDIASIAAFLWIFFEDVDFAALHTEFRGFIIAKKPRGIDPKQYSKPPITVSSTS